MSQIEIPEDWKIKTAGELFYIKGRIGWRGLKKAHFTEDGPYLITGVDFDSGNIDWKNCFHIPMDKFLESPEIIVQKDDILLTKDGTIGKVAHIDEIPDGKASLNAHIILIRNLKNNNVYPRYTYYVLQSPYFLSFVKSIQKSGTRPSLPQKIFEKFTISIPSYSEQQKIVEKLDLILGQFEEKKKQILELNDKIWLNSKLLIIKSAERFFSDRINSKWAKKQLGDLALESKNGCSGAPNNMEVGIKRLGIETVTQSKNEIIDLEYCKYFSATKSDMKKYSVNTDDLFVCRQNGNKHFVGKFALYKDNIVPLIFSDSLIRFRVDTDQVLPEYIVVFMNSAFARKQIDPFCKTAAGNYSINGTNLKKVIVDFPDKNKQKLIIDEIKIIQKRVDKMQRYVDSIIKLKQEIFCKYDDLQRSILNSAFSGNLIN